MMSLDIPIASYSHYEVLRPPKNRAEKGENNPLSCILSGEQMAPHFQLMQGEDVYYFL